MSRHETPEQRSAIMRAVRGKNTGPEWAIRRLVHRLGYRYRLHYRQLPGRPDLVFPSRRKVLFVHGCFWHGHDCPHGARSPKSNQDYWSTKLARNKARDVAQQSCLAANGWSVLIIWECETRDLRALEVRVTLFLGERDRRRLRQQPKGAAIAASPQQRYIFPEKTEGFMKKEEFRKYLLTAYRGKFSRKPLTDKTATDCISRLARLESSLDIDADEVDLSPAGIDALEKRLRDLAVSLEMSANVRRDCMSTLHRYAEFRQHRRR